MKSHATDSVAPYQRKIVTIDQLASTITALRNPTLAGGRRKTFVQCHGCFDIVHPGHVRYLQFARTLGDILVVSITGDTEINKGELRPYIPQELRAENLAALEFVDYVVIDPNPTAREILGRLRPDVYVKGREYAASNDPRFLAEREVVESYGGRVIFSSGQVVFSSTRLMENIARSSDLDAHRLAAICRRHDISQRRLSAVVGDIASRRVVVIGDSLVDRYALCDATEIASESPMMALNELDTEDYLGGAAVVALQAATLGAETVFVTALADCALSHWLHQTLESFGVSLHVVRRRADLPLNTRFLVDDRKLFKLNCGDAEPLDSIIERKTADALAAFTSSADAIIAYDCGRGMISPGLLAALQQGPRKPGAIMVGGAHDSPGSLTGLANMDLVCCSERRLRAASRDASAGLSTLAYQYMQDVRAERMIVTLGKRGLVAFDRPTHDRSSPQWHDRLHGEHLPSVADRVVDRLCVGETVLATAALAMCAGAGLMHAAYLGNAAAAIEIGVAGGVPIAARELETWFAGRPELEGPPPARKSPKRELQSV